LPADELADALVMAGIDVESSRSTHDLASRRDRGDRERRSHPDADRRLCEVRTGHDTGTGRCGASNMQAGDRYVAPRPRRCPTARRIERATIGGRAGIEGMLCSARELALADDDAGGSSSAADAPVGSALVEYLGAEDTVLDLAPTPNRGDCLSVLGIAREVAALTGARLHVPAPHMLEGEPAASALARVEWRRPILCPRYCARIMRGVQVGRRRRGCAHGLALVGLRSINNVVDVTNYVMLERGQPLHAFDLTRIAGRVWSYAGPEPGAAGDARRHRARARPDDLVIADAESPIAVAGVIAARARRSVPKTRDVLLESASSFRKTIRRTARRLGLATDSSFRFERGVDPAGTTAALDRAVRAAARVRRGTVARGMLERHAPGRRRNPSISPSSRASERAARHPPRRRRDRAPAARARCRDRGQLADACARGATVAIASICRRRSTSSRRWRGLAGYDTIPQACRRWQSADRARRAARHRGTAAGGAARGGVE